MFGKKIKKNNLVESWFVLAILFFALQGCNPAEVISDTFSGIVDQVSSEDNDDDLVVGQVLVQASFTGTANVDFSITVLSKAGSFIKDDTLVNCRYTNSSTGALVIEFDEPTVTGAASCGLTNEASTQPISFNFVATAEGVSSDALLISLPAGQTA